MCMDKWVIIPKSQAHLLQQEHSAWQLEPAWVHLPSLPDPWCDETLAVQTPSLNVCSANIQPLLRWHLHYSQQQMRRKRAHLLACAHGAVHPLLFAATPQAALQQNLAQGALFQQLHRGRLLSDSVAQRCAK